MASSTTTPIDFGAPIKTAQDPVAYSGGGGGPFDPWSDFVASMEMSTADALQVVANGAGIIQNAAAKISASEDVPLSQAIGDVRSMIEGMAKDIQPSPEDFSSPNTMAEKIMSGVARAAGGAIPTLALYGGATALTRSPARGMALVDALRETDQGAWEMAVAGVRGFASGKILDLTASIPSFPKRAVIGGSVVGAQGLLTGHSKEQVLTDFLVGAAMSAPLGTRPQAKVADSAPPRGGLAALPERTMPAPPKRRVRERTAEGIEVETPAKDLPTLTGVLQSPSVMFERFPVTSKAIDMAMEFENAIKAGTENWLGRAEKAFKRLPRDARQDIIKQLDDPSVSVLRYPSNLPSKYRETYTELRTLLEEARLMMIKAKRAIGEEIGDNWGHPEGYWPHMFRGNWAVLRKSKSMEHHGAVPDGGWLQMTQKDAIKVAKKWKAANPDEDVRVTLFDDMVMTGSGGSKNRSMERYFGHVQKRKVNLPGYIDEEAALYHYLRNTQRYAHLTELRPYMKAAKQELEGIFGQGSRASKLFDAYWSGIEGKPGDFTRAVNKMWMVGGAKVGSKLGLRLGQPDVVQRSLGFVQSVESLLKLGYSPVSAMNNMMQTMTNTLPVIGPKYVEKGIRGFVSGKYNWLLDHAGVLGKTTKAEGDYVYRFLRVTPPDIPRGLKDLPRFVGETASFGWNSTATLGMWMFQKAEDANRAVSMIGGYLRALDEGATFQQAVRKGEQVMRRTQFHYGPADSPIIFSTQFGRTIGQFRSFMLKQMEFMLGLTKSGAHPGRFDPRSKELSRFIGTTLSAVGVAGVPGMAILDKSWEIMTGSSLLDEWKVDHPRIARGLLGSAYGIDTRVLGYEEWPFDPDWPAFTQFTGPIVNDLYAAVRIADAAPGRDKQIAIKRFWQGASPAARRLYNAYLSEASKRGEIRNTRGRVVIDDLTATEKMLSAIGYKPLREAAAREEIGVQLERQRRLQSMYSMYLDRAADAIRKGDAEELDAVAKEAFENGFILRGSSVKGRLRSLALPLLEELGDRWARIYIPPEDRR